MRSFLLLGSVASVHCQTFTFAAAGDFATGSNFLNTLDAIKVAQEDLVLALGDLAYEEQKEQWWCQQWKNRTGVSDLLITAGDHEVGETCCGDLKSYLQYCPTFAQTKGEAGIRYFLDYPEDNPLARFIMITPGVDGSASAFNTYDVDENGKKGEGLEWVASTIDSARESNIPWVIVGMNKNYISTLSKSSDVNPALMNLLFTKRVDLILQAHRNGYERSKQLKCATVGSFDSSCVVAANPTRRGQGSTIVMLGTGGQGLESRGETADAGYFQVVSNLTYGFGHFLVARERLTYNFRRSGGAELRDSFSIAFAELPPSPAFEHEEPTVAEVNNFNYNAPGIIAIIALFLICVGVIAVIAIFMMIRQNLSHSPVLVDGVESKAGKNKRGSEGSIDYL